MGTYLSAVRLLFPKWHINCKAERKKDINYLLHFGDITNESVIIHKLAQTLQLVEVTDEVLTYSLWAKKN